MIRTVADLLQRILEKEKAVLAVQPQLNHSPMFGDMYEGVTRDLTKKKALFNGLDLRVVEGKARDSEGKLSGQLHGCGWRWRATILTLDAA